MGIHPMTTTPCGGRKVMLIHESGKEVEARYDIFARLWRTPHNNGYFCTGIAQDFSFQGWREIIPDPP